MNRLSSSQSTTPSDAWTWSVQLLERWQTGTERVDWLLESLPRGMGGGERARVQALLVGAVRNLTRIKDKLDRLMTRPPRPIVEAALIVAGVELLESDPAPGHAAKVGHHLVERVKQLASPKEAAFANAVGRKLAVALMSEATEPTDSDSADTWSIFYSHPIWLVERWREQLGDAMTRQLLVVNQTPASVTVRLRPGAALTQSLPAWLNPIDGAPDFYTAESGHWAELRGLLESGDVHVQDAATRLAIDLLDPQSGETVLDLCAAPGGKSLAMADRMQKGKIVAFDMPGRRMPRLEESLQRVPAGVETATVSGDLLRSGAKALEGAKQPLTYVAVLLDVPCSNTGVMRHRVDVKWRLQTDSFERHSSQQLDLLIAAAELVAESGRLVYSTCSIDREENEQVVNAFLKRPNGSFELEATEVSLPWQSGCDGAAAFRLRRVS